jgi:probable F420-dependent oxidoreductase
VKVETPLPAAGRGDAAEAARRAEALGYDRVTAAETAHNPFLPLAAAANATSRIGLATSIAIAFARSPMVTAQIAWDLREMSGGRFELGLGTQVKAHIQRRYSVPWAAPGPRMREYIQALRAIWRSWDEGGTRLSFTGEHYQFSLMTPEYSPGKSSYGPIPITVAGVGPYMARIAGEVCEGLRLHNFSTPKYVREVLLPEVNRARSTAASASAAFEVCAQPWLAIGDSKQVARQREAYRRAAAAFGSSRTYRGIWDVHGWGEVASRLLDLSLEQRWDDMARLVSDEMVDTFVIQGTPDEVVARVRAQWGPIASSVSFAFPREFPAGDDELRRCIEDLQR